MNPELFQRCILCKDAIDYEEIGLGLTDSSIGPGQLHRDCHGQLAYAQVMLKGAGLRECKRIQR